MEIFNGYCIKRMSQILNLRIPIRLNLIFLFMSYFLVSFFVQGKNIIKPNEKFNPSFDLMSMRNDSLRNWNVVMFGLEARYGRTKLGEREYVAGTMHDGQAGCAGFLIQKQFYYPDHSKKLQLSLKGSFFKQQRNMRTFLVVMQFKRGYCVQKDSLAFDNSDSMFVYHKMITLANGSDEAAICFKSDHYVGFQLDRMEILIDGLPIQKVTIPKYTGLPKRRNDLLKSSISDTFSASPLSNIIGIGESVHGSKTLSNNRNDLILDLIQKNKLDVLLLEVPGIIGLKFNRYVSCMDDTLKIDQQLYGFLANQEFGDLLNTIRKINQSRQNPIQIAGIDVPIQGFYIYAFKETEKYFKDALQNSDSEGIKMLYKNRRDSNVTYSDKELMMKDRQFWGEYSVSQLSDLNLFFIGPTTNNYRDSAMFVNAKSIIEHFGLEKKYVIWAHLGHLIKDPKYGQPGFFSPMGYFLDQYYKNKYQLIAQFVGSGKTLIKASVKNYNITLKDTAICLENPYEHSIEQVCAGIKGDSFYLTNWKNLKWINSVWRDRYIGFYRTDVEFFPFSLDYIDAIYYSKYSEPMELKTIVLKPQNE